jgi:hypothetical protein
LRQEVLPYESILLLPLGESESSRWSRLSVCAFLQKQMRAVAGDSREDV